VAAAGNPSGLIDTNVLIDAARGLVAASAFLLAQQAAGAIRISVISAMELVAGCRNAQELTQVQQFLAPVAILPVTEAVSNRARQFMESYFLSHGLTIPDALIAATAFEYGIPLYTRDLRHFHMISGLSLLQPY
jgi:predicted nucleic acid-binding protein